MYRAIKWKIRYFIEGVRNLIKWRKVIYHDKDFDHFFIYEILKTKLQFQAEHLKKYGYHTSAESDANKIMECVGLIEEVQNELIMDAALDCEDKSYASLKAAQEKHDATRKKLFETISDNIENWWD
jgi:hypothetical protein